MMNRLPGEKDGGQTNGWGHSVSISSCCFLQWIFIKGFKFSKHCKKKSLTLKPESGGGNSLEHGHLFV